MTVAHQIAIDCADPHRLAAFWAEAMQVEIEDHDEQIRGLVDAGVLAGPEYVERDGRLMWRSAAACRSDDGRTRLLFQAVPEAKQVKNRVHLDLHHGPDERDNEVERLVELGATRLWDGEQGPLRWVTMADPEGNEFCVA